MVKELFKRGPAALHVVDLSENNLVELVRDLRSSLGYFNGDFRTFALDAVSPVFDAMFHSEGPYDYVLNLSAMKHVRSEKDPYTSMRLLEINILGTIKLSILHRQQRLENISVFRPIRRRASKSNGSQQAVMELV